MLTDTPGKPRNESVDEVADTWVHMCWQHPRYHGLPSVSRYVVTAFNTRDSIVESMSTKGNVTRLNFTNLLPGVNYRFNVYAVAEALRVRANGQASDPFIATTRFCKLCVMYIL